MKGLLGGTLFVAFIGLALILSPLLLLWGINTMSEQAGSSFYIPHNLWTYLAAYAVTAVLRGS